MPAANRLKLCLSLFTSLTACGLVESQVGASLELGAADARPFDDGRPESSARDADAKFDSGVACAACGPVCPNTQVCVDGFCAAAPDAGTMCNGVFCSGTCAVGRCRGSVVAQHGSSQVPLVGPAVYADDTHLYWVDGDPLGTLMSVPLAGGSTTTLASGVVAPRFLAVDEATVYFAGTNPEQGTGGVMSVPLAGGPSSRSPRAPRLPGSP